MSAVFVFQAEDGIRDLTVTGVQTCALPIFALLPRPGPRPWRRAVAGPALLLVLTLAVVCWGVYAVYAAPDLMLAAPPGAGLVELPAVVLSAPGGRALVATCVLALLLLWVATALALRDVLAAYAGPASADIPGAGLLP